MNPIGIIVTSKAYGSGEIAEFNGRYITIKFDSGIKKFQFPNAFEFHLSTDDKAFSGYINIALIDKKKAEQEEKLAKEEINRKLVQATIKQNYGSNPNYKKKIPKENVTFKCNFCDGGASEHRIGFRGVCSDRLISYNIYEAKHTWCSCEDSDCLRYALGDISRKELDSFMKTDFGVCYESQMLNKWTAFAGIVQTGDRKGTPMKLNQVQAHSLCVLTTRAPGMPETDRYIFAAFLIDETFEGDPREAGYVSTSSEFKVELTPKEARTMKFWKYHANKNNPDLAAWNSGLHRYFDDEEAAQILKDIWELKKGTRDENLALRFFKTFCSINNLDDERVSKPRGALK